MKQLTVNESTLNVILL